MKLSWSGIVVAAIASLALHLALAAVFVPAETEIQIAGGTPVDLMIVGTAFEDALAAGEAADNAEKEILEPVDDAVPEIEPVEVDRLEASEPEDVQSVTAEPVEPVTAEKLESPAPTTAEPVEVETEAAEDVPSSELSAVAEVPVPQPRPKMTAAERARIAKPKTRKAEVSKPAAKKKQKKTKAAAKPKIKKKSAGNGGKQTANSSRGASKGAKTTKKQTRAGNAAVSNYPGKVASKLRRALRYPRAARKDRLKGQAVVSFIVAANGSVRSVRIARSSGFPVLDKAALEAVHRAAPFAPIPSAAGRTSWRFSVPLAFKR